MGTRVIISLLAGRDAQPVLMQLSGLGAASVRPPAPELPDVAIADVDEGAVDPAEWAERAAQLPGVQAAEVDRMRWST